MTYRIMESYQGNVELIDEFESRGEAKRMLIEYRMSFGLGWTLWVTTGRDEE